MALLLGRVLNLSCLALATPLVYTSFHELFVDVPGRHYARIHFADGTVVAYANVPTLTAAALLALGVILAVLPVLWRRLDVWRRAWVFAAGFGAAVFVELWAIMDVLGNAFTGVG